MEAHPRIGSMSVHPMRWITIKCGILSLQPVVHQREVNHHIADNDAVTLSQTVVESGLTYVDWVTVEVDIQHSAPSDLSIQVISPSGTKSTLATARSQRLNSTSVCNSLPFFHMSGRTFSTLGDFVYLFNLLCVVRKVSRISFVKFCVNTEKN